MMPVCYRLLWITRFGKAVEIIERAGRYAASKGSFAGSIGSDGMIGPELCSRRAGS
jgi:hypothetical protein